MRRIVFLAVLASILAVTGVLRGQSLISGDLAGLIVDTSGAVIPNATLHLRNTDSGESFSAVSNGSGAYRFALLKPGHYHVEVSSNGFSSTARDTTVQVGQQTTLNIALAIASSATTVQVTEEQPLLQTDHADISTAFDQQQVQYLPNPGNDLTYMAQVAPGALMNTESGTGNFTVFGLPGSSNVFTVNGGFEDTYGINVNYSAASNLLLGNNDIAEVTVVSPAYEGQYGSASGAYVTELTKSGGSQFHGNAVYWWNGRILNANNYFNKQSTPITPRPFDNVNQWAASIGGPVPHSKDKLHFFLNNEGIRIVLPTSSFVYIPSAAFQQAVLANVGQVRPAELNFYKNIFNIYNSAPGASSAIGVSSGDTSGCNGQTLIVNGTVFGGGGQPCAVQFRSRASNSTSETIYTGRADYELGASDHLFAHFKVDKGLQSSYTDPINSLFDASSKQPEYEGQLNESHIFSPNLANQFVFATMYYRGISSNPQLAKSLALFPATVQFSGGVFAPLGGENYSFPGGRNVTQYQFIDDLSWSKDKHTIKAGINFRRANMTNYRPSAGSVGLISGEQLADFANGISDNWRQNFSSRATQPVSLWFLGAYVQDQWNVTPVLKLTLSLRSDTESNPVCHTDCFARFDTHFLSLNHDVTTPYNQAIQTGLHSALHSLDALVFQPRFGLAWSVFGPNSKTVVRGGVGMFTDILPAVLADEALANLPNDPRFTVSSRPAQNRIYTLDPSLSDSASTAAAQSAAAFRSGFVSGYNYQQISAAVSSAGSSFAPPSFTNTAKDFHNPRYVEWSLSLQQQLPHSTVFTLNYIGNHGYKEPISNGGLNAYGFGSLPSQPTDAAFGTVTEVSNAGSSNYNGLTAQLQHRSKYATVQFNYTYSHALDLISNGGFGAYSYGTASSLLNPQNPFNINANYGNADYDVRHNFTASYIVNIPRLYGPKRISEGWRVAGTVFGRTGMPFSVIDSNTGSALSSNNYSGDILAELAVRNPRGLSSCDRNAAKLDGTPCLNVADFASPTGFNQQGRNRFRGPIYTNVDMSLYKATKLPGDKANLTVGLQAFNLFNHTPFDSPVNDYASGNFGRIITTATTPTSIMGAFLGGDSAPRQLQLTARFEF